MPPISVENGPLSLSSSGSLHSMTRSHTHSVPQHAPSSVHTTLAHGAIAWQVPWPSHTVPGPQVVASQASAPPDSTQLSTSWSLHSPLITSHTSSGPHGSGS